MSPDRGVGVNVGADAGVSKLVLRSGGGQACQRGDDGGDIEFHRNRYMKARGYSECANQCGNGPKQGVCEIQASVV